MVKGVGLICFAAAAFLALSAFYYKQSAREAEERCVFYKHNSEILGQKLKEAYENNVKTEKARKALEQAMLEDKTGFDWRADISRSPVILRLQAD